MRLALIAMPFQPFDVANAALGCLSSYMNLKSPDVIVDIRSEYINLWKIIPKEYELLNYYQIAGELIYLHKIYPLSNDNAIETIMNYEEDNYSVLSKKYKYMRNRLKQEHIERTMTAAEEHSEALAKEIAEKYDVIGLTTSMCQLFSSLYIARLVKEKNPLVKIILGGACVYSWDKRYLDVFPYVDYVIKGEGEIRLQYLIERIKNGFHFVHSNSGIICKMDQENISPLNESKDPDYFEIDNLAILPAPDYTEYSGHADTNNIHWSIPIEGSRGCWWDRRSVTKDIKDACAFCGMNQCATRREKTPNKIKQEIELLTNQYENHCFRFVDNILSKNSIKDISNEIRSLNMDLSFFCEIRASTSPSNMVDLWDAGCDSLQIGIEGLSTKYLERMNKGTSTIQNLQAMKTCYELGIRNISNLLIGFPGASDEEILETCKNIRDYAVCYEPINISKFCVDINSAVASCPEQYLVRDIRNLKYFQNCLPSDIEIQIRLPWLDHSTIGEEADWTSVQIEVKNWRIFHEEISKEQYYANIPKPLFYVDCKKYYIIIDKRYGNRKIILNEKYRSIYLFCMRIQSKQKIQNFFESHISKNEIDDILGQFVEQKLMFKENNCYLSLAVARRPDVAANRIREHENQYRVYNQ